MLTDSFKSWINIIIIYPIYPFSLSSEILSFLFGCCTNTNDPSKLFVSLFRLFFLWYIKTWWEWPFLLARSRWARFSDIIYLSSVVSLSRDDGWHSKYLTNLLYIGIFICWVLYIYIFQNGGGELLMMRWTERDCSVGGGRQRNVLRDRYGRQQQHKRERSCKRSSGRETVTAERYHLSCALASSRIRS